MPEGDLRDLYGVVRRVSSGRWRSGVRLTAEEDGEALQEKYGEKWLGRSATGHPKPPKVPSEAGTSAEAVAPESAAADDVSRHDEDDSGRPEESGKESQTEPATRDDLEDLLREAESWEVAPETDAAEAAKAVLEAEVARAEAQAKQEAAAAMAEAEAQAKQEAAAAKAEAEAQAKQEAIAGEG
jgi:chemotaxis protein histidine kinase CheA